LSQSGDRPTQLRRHRRELAASPNKRRGLTRLAKESTETLPADPDGSLGLALLTDDLKSETLAKQIIRSFARGCLGELQTRLSVWPFDSIDDRRTEQAVDNDIREADRYGCGGRRQPLPGGIEMAMGKWLLGPAAARFGLVEVLRRIPEESKSRSPMEPLEHVAAWETREVPATFPIGV